MKEFLNSIADSIEAGNFEEVERLSKNFLYPTFLQSLYEQLTETAYFPSLNPEFSKDFDRTKSKDELKKEAIKRIHDDPYLYATARCDEEGIKEITDYDFITLFEAALLIGYRIESDPKLIVFDSPALFMNAILNKQIDPRDPSTRIPFSKMHETPKVVDGEIFFTQYAPDLSWLLTLKEVAEFAILKGYPECLFADLLSDIPMTDATEPSPKETPVLPDKKPAYLDENHPMFSRELSIAVEAWEQVLSTNPPKQSKGTRKQLILNWLEEHHKKLPALAKERIAVMLNPDSNGGTPPSDGERIQQ